MWFSWRARCARIRIEQGVGHETPASGRVMSGNNGYTKFLQLVTIAGSRRAGAGSHPGFFPVAPTRFFQIPRLRIRRFRSRDLLHVRRIPFSSCTGATPGLRTAWFLRSAACRLSGLYSRRCLPTAPSEDWDLLFGWGGRMLTGLSSPGLENTLMRASHRRVHLVRALVWISRRAWKCPPLVLNHSFSKKRANHEKRSNPRFSSFFRHSIAKERATTRVLRATARSAKLPTS